MEKILIPIFLILFSYNSRSQWPVLMSDADSLIKVGSDYIYNIQFDNADECFKKVITKYPDNPAGYFLDAMTFWWKLSVFRENNLYDDKFLQKIDKVLEICDKLLDKNPFDIKALFFKGGALGFRGRFNVIRKSWFRAATDGYNAFEILLKCYEIAPSNHDIMLGTGIYNYFSQALPEEYPSIKPLMLFAPNGDKKLGILQLKAAAQDARYANMEAKVVLLQLYYDFEKNPIEALKISEELHIKYPNNPFFQRYLGRCLISTFQTEKADSVWRDALNRYISHQPGYDVATARESMYYIGNNLMNKRNLDLALKYFYKCDEASRKIDKEESGFMILSNLKIGKIYDLLGKKDLAVKQFKKVLTFKDYLGSHNEANEYLNNPTRK